MSTPQLVALSGAKLVVINDLDKLHFIDIDKNLNLLLNSQNSLILAGHDGVYELDSSFSNMYNLVLPVTVESALIACARPLTISYSPLLPHTISSQLPQ